MSTTTTAPDLSSDAREYTRIVHYRGHHYAATRTMADIFLAHAADVIDRDETALVPLLHDRGVDLLLISPSSTIQVSQLGNAPTRQADPVRLVTDEKQRICLGARGAVFRFANAMLSPHALLRLDPKSA